MRDRDLASNIELQVDCVEKEYRSRGAIVKALAPTSFIVRTGEFVSVVGPSGCGKSTLLKIILGVVPRTHGRLFRGAQEIEGPQLDIGMVFQTPTLLPWRSVIDNVLLPIEILGQPRNRYFDRARDLLGRVGLHGFELRPPRELSGGMQQRVSICRALVSDPKLLLLDEPFGALDAITREGLQAETLRIWENSHKSVVFVTHSIDEAIMLSDRVLLMSARPGQITADIEIDLPRPRSIEVRVDAKYQKYALDLRRGLAQMAPA